MLLDSDSCWKGEGSTATDHALESGHVPTPSFPPPGLAHRPYPLQRPQGHRWTRDTRAAPSEPPQKGSHEKHEAAGPGGTLLPRCEIPQSFPTRKQRELSLGFSKSAARHQTSVWHQLGANCCAPSVGEPAGGPRAISAGFPVGFIFRSPGRQSTGRAVSSAPAGPAPRRPSARSRRWSTPLPWHLDLQGRARHTG